MKKAFAEGVNEIWLTSEDTGAYGRDINTSIVDLLILLVENLPPNKMLRVGMTNPPYILEHLQGISEILNHPQVYKFLHIPVQAGDDTTLERMNREYTVEDFSKVCDALLQNVDQMTVSTDVICGFPGETDAQFKGTLDLIKKYKFPILNISQFYPRPGTVAERMKQCLGKVKKDRSRQVTKLFEGYKDMHHMKDTEERVWFNEWEVNKKEGKVLIGHTQNYSKVVHPFEEELLGKSVIMKFTKTFKWHVAGEIVDRDPPDLVGGEGALNKVKELYERIRKEREETIKRRKEERKKRLKALIKKAREEERARIKALKEQEERDAELMRRNAGEDSAGSETGSSSNEGNRHVREKGRAAVMPRKGEDPFETGSGGAGAVLGEKSASKASGQFDYLLYIGGLLVGFGLYMRLTGWA